METLSDKKEYENALEYIKMKEFIRNSTDEKNVDSLIKKYEILQQENTQLKQQLKDKDEKISKVKELLEEASLSSLSPFELFKIEEEINEILESNKED